MLKNNTEAAELVVAACFRISKLKKVIRSEENLKILDFLESHDHLNNAIKNALKAGNKELFRLKVMQIINHTDDLIKIKDDNLQDINNIAEAAIILKDIKDHLLMVLKKVENENFPDQGSRKMD
jgi:tellurite resistance protein